jgi:hypothetical protein
MGLMANLRPAGAVVLAEDGQAKAVIVAPASPAGDVTAAIDDLRTYVERISGARLSVVASRGAAGGAIVLRSGAAGLSPVGYRLRVQGRDLIIEGATPAGLVNGIYGLLEDHFGVHWYIPGPLGEYVPHTPTLRLDQLDEVREPAISSVTGIGGYPADPPRGAEWARRNRLAGFSPYWHSHNWAYLIPESERERHPEWFALIDGERKDQLCTTNPEVIRIAIARTLDYFAQHPEAKTFSLSPNDSGNFCQCERCRALDRQLEVDPMAPGGQFTDRLVYFFNSIAEAVAKKYPDKILCFYAYVSHTDPPRKVKPLPNLMPVLCHTPWEFCHAHPLSAACAPAKRFREDVVGWRELCPHVGIYDYYGHYAWFGQWPLVHDLREDIPFYARIGVEHLNSETHANWWTQPLNFFVAVRLVWNVRADVDALVHDFCVNLFGPAASPVEQYFARYERAMAGIPLDAYRNDEDWKTYPSPALMEEGEALLAEAGGLAATPEQKERVRKLQLGHQIFVLQWQQARGDQTDDILATTGAQTGLLSALEQLDLSGERDVVDLGLALPPARKLGVETQRYLDILAQAGYDTPEKRATALQSDSRALSGELGYIGEWLIIGPFSYRPGNMDNAQIPLDRLDPAAQYQAIGGKVGWRRYATENAFGIVDLRQLLSKDPGVAAYAVCWVNLPAPRAITLRLGSNDGAAVWLGGKPLLMSDVPRGFAPDIDRVSVTGQQSGWQLLVVKVANHGGRWKFALRFTTEEGQPIAVPSRVTPPESP